MQDLKNLQHALVGRRINSGTEHIYPRRGPTVVATLAANAAEVVQQLNPLQPVPSIVICPPSKPPSEGGSASFLVNRRVKEGTHLQQVGGVESISLGGSHAWVLFVSKLKRNSTGGGGEHGEIN